MVDNACKFRMGDVLAKRSPRQALLTLQTIIMNLIQDLMTIKKKVVDLRAVALCEKIEDIAKTVETRKHFLLLGPSLDVVECCNLRALSCVLKKSSAADQKKCSVALTNTIISVGNVLKARLLLLKDDKEIMVEYSLKVSSIYRMMEEMIACIEYFRFPHMHNEEQGEEEHMFEVVLDVAIEALLVLFPQRRLCSEIYGYSCHHHRVGKAALKLLMACENVLRQPYYISRSVCTRNDSIGVQMRILQVAVQLASDGGMVDGVGRGAENDDPILAAIIVIARHKGNTESKDAFWMGLAEALDVCMTTERCFSSTDTFHILSYAFYTLSFICASRTWCACSTTTDIIVARIVGRTTCYLESVVRKAERWMSNEKFWVNMAAYVQNMAIALLQTGSDHDEGAVSALVALVLALRKRVVSNPEFREASHPITEVAELVFAFATARRSSSSTSIEYFTCGNELCANLTGESELLLVTKKCGVEGCATRYCCEGCRDVAWLTHKRTHRLCAATTTTTKSFLDDVISCLQKK